MACDLWVVGMGRCRYRYGYTQKYLWVTHADPYEWAQTYLQTAAVGSDTVHHMEVMMAMRNVQDRMSMDPQDLPHLLQLAWWYPPEEMASVPMPRTSMASRDTPPPTLADVTWHQMAPPETGEVSKANKPYDNGWNGPQIVYLQKKKKRKSGMRSGPKRKDKTDESDDDPLFRMGPILSIPEGTSTNSG